MTPVRLNAAARRGASLTEVLMALMIMAIGLSSIFTLFPLSIVRSIRATQLTNAQLMRGNVEQLFRVTPDYFAVQYLPSGPGSPNWQAGTNYPLGSIIYPSSNRVRLTNFDRFRSQVSLPFENYRVTSAYDTTAMTWTAGSGNSGTNQPQWPTDLSTVDDNQLRWTPVTYSNWVIDPLGWYSAKADGTFNVDGSLPDGADHFGVWCGDSSGTTGDSITTASSVGSWTTPLRRINAGLTNITAAGQLASHPDAWSQVDTFTPLSAVSSTVLELPPGTKITSTSGSLMRATIRNTAGTQSISSSFSFNTSMVPPQLTLTSAAMPTTISSDLGTVTIESFDSRYTWFATVNNVNPAAPIIKVATVFKRKFTPGEEHVYRSVHGSPPGGYSSGDTDVDNALTVGLARDQVLVAWNPSTEPRPLIKEGSFLFDPTPTAGGGTYGVQWYGIEAVTGELTSGSLRYVVVTLDQPVVNQAINSVMGRAMFIRGLIDVYQL